MSKRESDLVRKLAETFHLSVLERTELPGGVVRGAVLVDAVRAILDGSGWYPADWRPDTLFDGLLIEVTEGKFVIHERHEIGVSRFSEVSVSAEGSLRTAVRRQFDRMFGATVDGVPIDWSR